MFIAANGVHIEVTTGWVLAAPVTGLQALVLRPDETTYTKDLADGDLVADTTKVRVPIDTGDLTVPGLYRIQIRQYVNGSITRHTDIGEFPVEVPLVETPNEPPQ